jgi:hypothetical protein
MRKAEILLFEGVAAVLFVLSAIREESAAGAAQSKNRPGATAGAQRE